jgi:hypothetical protein
MRPFAIVVSLIASIGVLCGLAAVESGQAYVMQAESVSPVTLSNVQPIGSFPVSTRTIKSAPAILELSVFKVENPDATPVVINVYFVPEAATAAVSNYRIAIGNFSLYPPDHSAGFMLDASRAFRQLRRSVANQPAAGVRLLLEMKRLNPKRPWTPLTLTIAPPRW